MAIEYDLTCSGDTPVNQMAERALPDPDDRPTGTAPLLSAALDARCGFGATILAGTNGYVDALSDDGSWEWEPSTYVLVGFRLDKEADRRWAVTNMLTVVRRVLDSGSEDAALVLNGDLLLLTRFDGLLVKHNRDQWWSHYPGAHDAIPG
jgi:hypothetical protein